MLGDVPLDKFLDLDKDLPTCEEVSEDNEITDVVEVDHDSDDEESEKEQPDEPCNLQEADRVIRALIQHGMNKGLVTMVDHLAKAQDILHRHALRQRSTQTTLLSFFKKV